MRQLNDANAKVESLEAKLLANPSDIVFTIYNNAVTQRNYVQQGKVIVSVNYRIALYLDYFLDYENNANLLFV